MSEGLIEELTYFREIKRGRPPLEKTLAESGF